jgi:hypothetical protein
MKLQGTILVICLFSFSVSCKHETLVVPGPAASKICFQQEVLPLFQTYCSRTQGGCHDAGNPRVSLVDYSGIIRGIKPFDAKGSWFYNDIGKGMPPYGEPQLSESQLKIIEQWINEGAKETSCAPGNCDSSQVGYRNNVELIFASYCNGCHGNDHPQAGLQLSTYEMAKATIKADTALFLHAIQFSSAPQKNMPPFGKLPDCELNKLENWVLKGMPY